MIYVPILCLILFLGSQYATGNPVTEYNYSLGEGAWLRLHIVPLPWSDAALRCQLEGGVLAYPTSDITAKLMVAAMDEHKVISNGVFIGATDQLSKGDFKTLEGMGLGDIASLEWAAPNNAGGAEDCVALTGAGALADVSCARGLPYLCHKSTYNVPSTNDIAKEVTTEESNAGDEASNENADVASDDVSYTSTTGLPRRCPNNGSQYATGNPVTEYNYSLGEGTWLRLHIVPLPWSDAALRCQLEGGVLAYPTSDITAKLMVAAMDEHKVISNGVFIGATDQLSKGDFKTLEGMGLGDIASLEWAAGEPNNAGGAEDCVALTGAGALADVSCARGLPYFCHKSTYNVPSTNDIAKEVTTEESNAGDEASNENADVASDDVSYTSTTGLPRRCPNNDYKWEPRTGSCYKLHRFRNTWVGALATCHKEGGHLAIINSETESIVLKEMYATMVQTKPRHLYIGFAKYGRNFATIYGQTLAEAGFDRWSDNEPNNCREIESCGSIHPNGLLNDAPCDRDLYPFICEITP